MFAKLNQKLWLLLLVLTGTAVIFVKFASSSSQGYIHQTSSGSKTYDATRVHSYSDKLFQISFPEIFKQVKSDAPSNDVLATAAFTKQSLPYWNLNIVVYKLLGGDLDNFSQYKYRKQAPDEYNLSTIKIDAKQIPISTYTKNGYSKIAYLVSDETVATISLRGPSSESDTLNEVLTNIIESFSWNPIST